MISGANAYYGGINSMRRFVAMWRIWIRDVKLISTYKALHLEAFIDDNCWGYLWGGLIWSIWLEKLL